MTEAEKQGALTADLAALARGGRINFFGFILRLLARLPFLFIAGRIYGAEALGRFAYAVLIVEFAAQLATLGLKRGLAQQLSQTTDKPHVFIVWDALLVAAVSESALIYCARHRNMVISLAMIVLQALLTVGLILVMQEEGWSPMAVATGPAMALLLALGFAAVAKSRLLHKLMGAPVAGWRWTLVWAGAAAGIVGYVCTLLPPQLEWLELVGGIPAILFAFGLVIWTKGFGPEDRELFRMGKDEIEELSLPDPSIGANAPR